MAKNMLEIAPKLGVYGLRDIRWATDRSWGEADSDFLDARNAAQRRVFIRREGAPDPSALATPLEN